MIAPFGKTSFTTASSETANKRWSCVDRTQWTAVAGTQKGCARRFLRLFPNLGFCPIVLERGSTGRSIARLRVRVYDDAVSMLGQFNSLQVCLCLSEETQKPLDLVSVPGEVKHPMRGGGCGVGGDKRCGLYFLSKRKKRQPHVSVNYANHLV